MKSTKIQTRQPLTFPAAFYFGFFYNIKKFPPGTDGVILIAVASELYSQLTVFAFPMTILILLAATTQTFGIATTHPCFMNLNHLVMFRYFGNIIDSLQQFGVQILVFILN